jgi:hypothetical protein
VRHRGGIRLIGAVLLAYALALQSLVGAWAHHAPSGADAGLLAFCLTEHGESAPAPAAPAAQRAPPSSERLA